MEPLGLMIAAPASGSGKTVVSLGIMAALKARGMDVRAAKSGPDYIDPAFHAIASGAASLNLDAWAMPPDELRERAGDHGGHPLIIEAAMGALDGAGDGTGSAADLAQVLGIPVVLVIDAAKSGPSAALPVAGFRALRPDIQLGGIILNRVGSPRHEVLASAAIPSDVPVLGSLPRSDALVLPERHLGLVQASELPDMPWFLEHLAGLIENRIDLDRLVATASPLHRRGNDSVSRIPPLGQRIAIARDVAFAFAYPHLLDDWRAQGAEVLPFSPLADEAPSPDADAIFLPGGYPELHAEKLALAGTFRRHMRMAAQNGTTIYGECGGYMVLGKTLRAADGTDHPMLDLLPVKTSFETRKLSLGYRKLTPLAGPFSGPLMAHEFHYATVQTEDGADRLFQATDAAGRPLPDMGLVRANVSGSFAHIIAPGRA